MKSLPRSALPLLLLPLLALARAAEPAPAPATLWQLEQAARVGGLAPTVLGAPTMMPGPGGPALHFNGTSDGLLLPVNPLAGYAAFTVEILFYPEEGGPEAQRFVHIQDSATRRVMIETRLDGHGGWWLDTFLSNGGRPGQALIDPKHAHPTNRWYWAALTYDGKHMTHFINGEKELEADFNFGPMVAGLTSLGVRQNKVYWFKGGIREVRFHATALAPEKLQRLH